MKGANLAGTGGTWVGGEGRGEERGDRTEDEGREGKRKKRHDGVKKENKRKGKKKERLDRSRKERKKMG